MKRLMCILLALTALLCGCGRIQSDATGDSTASQTETAAPSTGDAESTPAAETTAPAAETEPDATELDVTELSPEEVTVTLPKTTLPGQTGEALELGDTGAERVTYTHNVSRVQYVTDVRDLPDYAALSGYDAAYFQDHALLIVLETVSNGSVKVAIDRVADDGTVTLKREISGQLGTTVMTTWLLWAEVDAGLDCSWNVANAALQSGTSKS